MDFLNTHPEAMIRFRLLRDGEVHYYLEMTLDQWRTALGKYYYGWSNWQRHGYIVAITRRRGGEYTEEFQRRWARYVRTPDSPPRTTSTP